MKNPAGIQDLPQRRPPHPPSRLRVNRVVRRRTLTSGGLLACAGRAQLSLDPLLPGWPGRGLPSPSRKGAGVWLPE